MLVLGDCNEKAENANVLSSTPGLSHRGAQLVRRIRLFRKIPLKMRSPAVSPNCVYYLTSYTQPDAFPSFWSRLMCRWSGRKFFRRAKENPTTPAYYVLFPAPPHRFVHPMNVISFFDKRLCKTTFFSFSFPPKRRLNDFAFVSWEQ